MTGSPIAGPEFIKRSVNGIFSGEDFTRFSCLGFALSTMLMFPAERYVRAAANLFSVTLGPQVFFFSCCWAQCGSFFRLGHYSHLEPHNHRELGTESTPEEGKEIQPP